MTDENNLKPEDHPAPAEATHAEEPAAAASDAPEREPAHEEATPHVVADQVHADPAALEATTDHVADAAPGEHGEAEHGEAERHPQPATAEEPQTKPAKRTRKPKAAAAEVHEATPATPEADAEAGPAADGEAPPAAAPAATGESSKKWYVVKVTSGREDSIKAAVERKVKIEGLEEFFGQIAIPVEELIQKKTVRVTDKKTGEKVTQEKKVVKHQKKFPGYIFAEVDFNDRILYLFRETSGVGDFVGASLNRAPTPMTDREVRAMLTGVVEGEPGKPNQKAKVKLDYEKGDKVKIRDGAFANMEGIVKSIMENKDTGETPKVKVEVTIFGRPVEVDLDYWHVDKA
jgi:transcriptional antiterminator NusG